MLNICQMKARYVLAEEWLKLDFRNWALSYKMSQKQHYTYMQHAQLMTTENYSLETELDLARSL